MHIVIGTLSQWQTLVSDSMRPLREAAASTVPGDLQAISRLRKTWPAELVSLAVELQDARRRGHSKFPDHTALIADVDGMQQATPWVIAKAKAHRFPTGMRILDGCCGIGGDTMALADRGDVTAVDIDPIRCWMTACNAGCETSTMSITDVDDSFDAFHVDPARRDLQTGRRARNPEHWHPPLSALDELRARTTAGVIKLGPGIDPGELSMRSDDELEFCSLGGSLSQAHLWCGALATAPGQSRATRHPDGLTVTGLPAHAPCTFDGVFQRWLAEADPALERARLHGAVGAEWNLAEPSPGIGLLTGSTRPESTWFSVFEVLEQMPWRQDRVKQAITALDPGVVEVKTRDGVVDPDPIQRRLSGRGTRTLTLFVLRCGRSETALITQRVTSA
jgi:hypothetical protein